MHFLISLIKVFFFVPYRGTTFLNTLYPTYARQTESGFRFLSGSYISQWNVLLLTVNSTSVSVPYRGATFLNCLNIEQGEPFNVSVPYRGATFLNYNYICVLNRISLYCFRPLSGSYISQYNNVITHNN